jgi:predicted LPLAT superfamily acyltransferase
MNDSTPQSAVNRSSGRAQWTRRPERGSPVLLKFLAQLSLRIGRPPTRLLLYIAVGYFFLFAPTARRHARVYLARALGKRARARDWFRLLLSFASTIHDRVYLLNERYDVLQISSQGEDMLLERLRRNEGAVLIGAHMGSFDVVRALGRDQPGLRIAMAMYQENARKVSSMLAAIAPHATPDIIALGEVSAMLRISERLAAGSLVGMLGDRSLGNDPGQAVRFLGALASFPLGPLRLAAVLRQPVIFMLGLYVGSNRYHVVFEPLADFAASDTRTRNEAVQLALIRYVQLLEKYCRLYPYNWFNFYDFWQSATGNADA